jgi:alkyl hydroperoxide reductase subunit AhpF
MIVEPERQLPVLAEAEVLVVGGGPAGTTAAIAAAPTWRHFDWRPSDMD